MTTVMEACSSVIRGTIIAPPGKKLVVSDLSNIEGRGLAWLAGETWKIEAFREFDVVFDEEGAWWSGERLRDERLSGNRFPLARDEKGDLIHKGPDLYKLAYAKSFKVDPSEVTKFGRSIGKVQELALGYAGGVNAFVAFALVYSIDLEEMADLAYDTLPSDLIEEVTGFLDWLETKGTVYPMSRKAAIVCDSFKRLWRQAHPKVVQMWADLENGFREATQKPGVTIAAGRFKIRRDGAWLRIMLPSGRSLCYPHPRVGGETCPTCRGEKVVLSGGWQGEIDPQPARHVICPTCEGTGHVGKADGSLSFMGVNQFNRKWQRLNTFGGKLAENCIAEGTPVLTDHGWVPIQCVRLGYRVWDGHAWAQHAGLVYSGKQTVVQAFGVTMTPDHLVLTTEGWKNASSCKGHSRSPCGLPDGYTTAGIERQKNPLGGPMRLWDGKAYGGGGAIEAAAERGNCVLRMHAPGDNREKTNETRYVKTSCLRGVEVDAGQMPASNAPSLEELWWAWRDGVRTVARVLRELLGGYGADLSAGVLPGATGQLERIFTGQLRLANVPSTSEQYPQNGFSGHTYGSDVGSRSGRAIRDGSIYPGVQTGQRLAGSGGPHDTCELHESKVYDLKNCGPRSRFVVLSEEGIPVIVHNCTQSFARDILFDATPAIEDAGYRIVMKVHDEVITEAPDSPEFNSDHLSALLSIPPAYALDMPLAAAGFESYRYRKD